MEASRVWSCGICGGQSGAEAGFLRVLQFPLPIFIPPVAPQSLSSIIWRWYNRPVVTAVPSGLGLTPLIIIIITIGEPRGASTPFYLHDCWLEVSVHTEAHATGHLDADSLGFPLSSNKC
jgi:hypothetical protein